MVVLVYMDDIVLPRKNAQTCKDFKIIYMHVSVCPLKYSLGIEVARDPQGIFGSIVNMH